MCFTASVFRHILVYVSPVVIQPRIATLMCLYGKNNILYYVLINVHVDVSGYLISKKPATGSRCFVKFSIAT